METQVEFTRTVIMTLQENEAIWLQEIMQNPFGTIECSRDRTYREGFLTALKDVLKTRP